MTDRRPPLLRQATTDDLPTVFAVLNDVGLWLDERGIRQRPSYFDRRGWRDERIGGYVDAGWVWIASDPRGAIAVMTLSPEADPDFAHGWPDCPDDALYIYWMAIVRLSLRRVGWMRWMGPRAELNLRPIVGTGAEAIDVKACCARTLGVCQG